MNENELLKLATQRVENDQSLTAYRDLLIDYDWQEGEEHLTWVLTAPTAELIAWAEGIRDDEQMQERIEAIQAEEVVSQAAATLGRRTSETKAAAARINGRLGGRPRKSQD